MLKVLVHFCVKVKGQTQSSHLKISQHLGHGVVRFGDSVTTVAGRLSGLVCGSFVAEVLPLLVVLVQKVGVVVLRVDERLVLSSLLHVAVRVVLVTRVAVQRSPLLLTGAVASA
jgi:hypothetical protein